MVQLEERLCHTCVSYSVATPCKCKASTYASFVVSYVLLVCFFPRADIDFALKPSINDIENCFTVCSHLDTLACSSCVSYKVHLGETLTSRSAADVDCSQALVCSNGWGKRTSRILPPASADIGWMNSSTSSVPPKLEEQKMPQFCPGPRTILRSSPQLMMSRTALQSAAISIPLFAAVV